MIASLKPIIDCCIKLTCLILGYHVCSQHCITNSTCFRNKDNEHFVLIKWVIVVIEFNKNPHIYFTTQREGTHIVIRYLQDSKVTLKFHCRVCTQLIGRKQMKHYCNQTSLISDTMGSYTVCLYHQSVHQSIETYISERLSIYRNVSISVEFMIKKIDLFYLLLLYLLWQIVQRRLNFRT